MNKIYFYPVWIRIWHLINALLFLGLIFTGISMQYASKDSITMIRFDTAISIHNVCGIILSINYLLFLFGNIASGNIKYYKIQISGMFLRIIKQFKYYLFGIFKGEQPPFPLSKERKFNPLQQFTYVGIMFIAVPLVIASGWALMFPTMIIDKIFGISGLLLTDLTHIVMGFFGSIFMIIHIYFCTIGATFVSNFKSMINGWHELH